MVEEISRNKEEHEEEKARRDDGGRINTRATKRDVRGSDDQATSVLGGRVRAR